MVLNLSIRINEAQTQEMIGAKRDFFFKFIDKEVAALRYQVAQECNYEQKNPIYAREAQGGKPYNKNKKLPPQYPCPVGCGD